MNSCVFFRRPAIDRYFSYNVYLPANKLMMMTHLCDELFSGEARAAAGQPLLTESVGGGRHLRLVEPHLVAHGRRQGRVARLATPGRRPQPPQLVVELVDGARRLAQPADDARLLVDEDADRPSALSHHRLGLLATLRHEVQRLLLLQSISQSVSHSDLSTTATQNRRQRLKTLTDNKTSILTRNRKQRRAAARPAARHTHRMPKPGRDGAKEWKIGEGKGDWVERKKRKVQGELEKTEEGGWA